MAASNTHECFGEFVGQKLVGMLYSALPYNRADLAAGNRSMIFEDGRALTLSNNGSYWIDSAEDVQRAVKRVRAKLERTERETREVLILAGDDV